jgi:carbamoyl-phosphate synthase large subunit
LLHHIPYYTTLAGALAVTKAIRALRAGGLKVAPLQSYVGGSPRDLAETA